MARSHQLYPDHISFTDIPLGICCHNEQKCFNRHLSFPTFGSNRFFNLDCKFAYRMAGVVDLTEKQEIRIDTLQMQNSRTSVII